MNEERLMQVLLAPQISEKQRLWVKKIAKWCFAF